jgi:hypothetical protein
MVMANVSGAAIVPPKVWCILSILQHMHRPKHGQRPKLIEFRVNKNSFVGRGNKQSKSWLSGLSRFSRLFINLLSGHNLLSDRLNSRLKRRWTIFSRPRSL